MTGLPSRINLTLVGEIEFAAKPIRAGHESFFHGVFSGNRRVERLENTEPDIPTPSLDFADESTAWHGFLKRLAAQIGTSGQAILYMERPLADFPR